jgi:hypothetical protein
MLRDVGRPTLKRACGGQVVERGVDLDGVETVGVEAEHLLGGED